MRDTSGPRRIPDVVIEALRRTGLFETAPDARFDAVTRLVRDVLDVPVCLVSLLHEDRQVFKGAAGLREPWSSRRQTPLSHSFCRHVVDEGRPLRITDSRQDPRVRDNPAIAELGVIAYLGIPVSLAGVPIGALCAIDHRPRTWTGREIDRLEDFGRIVDSEIELRRLADERDRARGEAELMAREHAHRVKNSLSVAASLVTLSASQAGSVQEAAKVARARILALANAQNLLWTAGGGGELRALLDVILGPYTLTGDTMIRIEGQPVALPEDKIAPLGLIFHELATNASKHGALSVAGGAVDLDWRRADDRLSIRWSEHPPASPGLAEASAEFHAHVDKIAEGEGFGTELVGLCARQLSARLEVGERPDGGREIAITLPWPGAAAAA